MCTRVLGLPDNFILEMYISRLRDDIQAEVLRDRPEDIHEAFELSLLVESQKSSYKGGFYKPFLPKSTKTTPFTPFAPSNTSLVTTKPTGHTNHVPTKKTNTNKFPVFNDDTCS